MRLPYLIISQNKTQLYRYTQVQFGTENEP